MTTTLLPAVPLYEAGPDTPADHILYSYEIDTHRPLAVCLCPCGARATGRALYYHRHNLIAIRDFCPDHLPDRAHAYTTDPP